MKLIYSAIALFALLATVFIANAVGLIGFHYPQAVENEALLDPVAVKSVSEEKLLLGDGRVLQLDHVFVSDLDKSLAETGSQIEIGENGEIYIARYRWICGTPWATLIEIPLFADEVPLNHRELVGVAASIRPPHRDGG